MSKECYNLPVSELDMLTPGRIAEIRGESAAAAAAEGAGDQELSVQQCPFLEAPALAECMTPEQVKIWKQVNELAKVVCSAVHQRFNEVLDDYRYTAGDRPIGPSINVNDRILEL